MKKYWIGVLVMLSLLVLAGCSKGEEEDKKGGFYLYFIDTAETKLVKEEYTPKATEREKLVDEVLQALHKGPTKDVTNKKTIPDNVNLPTCSYPATNQLQLRFDATYQELTGISELLRRAAIVKTLCQIEGIKTVEFYVADISLMDSDGKTVGVMNASSFIENSDYKLQQEVVLYYSNKDKTMLEAVNATANYDGSTSLERIVINQLIQGPETIGDLKQEVIATIPKKTKCLNITTVDYTCYVDLNKEFLNLNADMPDEYVIYSIVNSLASLPTINKVKFTIEGETMKSYGSVENFDQFFEKNYSFIKE